MILAFLRGSEIGVLVLIVIAVGLALVIGFVWLLIKIIRKNNHGN